VRAQQSWLEDAAEADDGVNLGLICVFIVFGAFYGFLGGAFLF